MQLSAALVDKLRGASRRTTSVGLLCALVMGYGVILYSDTEQPQPFGPAAFEDGRGLQVMDDAEELMPVDADFELPMIDIPKLKPLAKNVHVPLP